MGCGRKFERHGHTKIVNGKLRCSPEYRCWQTMKIRCAAAHRPDFKNYGARGITVCDRWRDSFVAFLEDMGLRPGPGYSIDRTDNELGYSPENCRWVTRQEQNRNKRSVINVTWHGKTQCIEAWAQELGIQRDLLRWRLRHWDLDRAMTEKVQFGPRPKSLLS